MTKPRLLQIGKYFSPDEGGIETVSLGVSEGLEREGIRADILCFSQGRDYDDSGWPWTVVRSPTHFRLWNKSISLGYARRLRALEPHYDVGLLHVPNPIGLAAVRAFWRKPLILLWHSDILGFRALGRSLRPLERMTVDQASAILVPAHAHIDGSYLREAMAPKAHLIPFPFDPAWLPQPVGSSALMERVSTFTAGRRMMLAIGRLVPYKGFDVLITAAAKLDPDIAVCIAGSGPSATQLQQQIVLAGGEDRVMMLGRVSNDDLVRLYRTACALVVPSVTRQEMYGMTQVEAMAFGVPVISTRIAFSAVSEVNRHGVTGLTVTPGDPTLLADAMNRITRDPDLRARLARGALAQFHDEHRIEVFGRRLAALVTAVAGPAFAMQAATPSVHSGR